jgi:hypothetical protein
VIISILKESERHEGIVGIDATELKNKKKSMKEFSFGRKSIKVFMVDEYAKLIPDRSVCSMERSITLIIPSILLSLSHAAK